MNLLQELQPVILIFYTTLLLTLFIVSSLNSQTIINTINQPGLNPTSIIVYEKMNKVFVADTSDKILVYNGNTMTIIDTIITGIKNIDQMVLVEQSGKLYAARCQVSNNKLAVIDANADSLIKIMYTGGIYSGGFIQLAKDETFRKVYYVCVGEVCQVDVATDSKTLIPGLDGTVYSSLAVNPVTHEIFYLRALYNPPLSVINAFDLSHFYVDIGGYGLGINWKENKIYIAYTGGGASHIYKRNTGSISNTSTANDATILVYNPKFNKMYSSSEIDRRITVIDGSTDSSFNLEGVNYVPYVCDSTGHVFYPGYPMWIIDDSTLSRKKFDCNGHILTIDQKMKRIYVGSIDTIRVIQDQNDSWPISPTKLLEPANNSKGIPLTTTLKWRKVDNAISYQVQVSRFYSLNEGLYSSDIYIEDISDTSILIGLHSVYKTFFWRVRALNDEVISNWSSIDSFKTILGPPSSLYPTYFDDSVSTNPIFRWDAADGAASYRLQVSEKSNFTTTIFDQSNITGTSFQVNGLTPNTTYYWRMNSSNNDGTSAFGALNWFTPSKAEDFCTNISVYKGWNIISIPLIENNMSLKTIFPEVCSNVYGYENGYLIIDTLHLKKGYWLKFDNPDTVEICGLKTADNFIPLSSGWNLIGLYNTSQPVENVFAYPGTLTSAFFGYDNGYIASNTLESGKGYWIKTSEAGRLIIAGNGTAERTTTSNKINKDWGRIIITDSKTRIGVLYIAKNDCDLSLYELPPIPPNGIFDFRFTSDRFVEELNSGIKEIKISSAEYPITLRVEGSEIKISDIIGGKIVNLLLKDGESLTIDDPSIEVLKIESKSIIPARFILYLNYPNPFNPVTTIKYSIPSDSRVRLEIFNSLGEVVSVLTDKIQSAGTYEENYDASNLSSGIYFYSIIATATDGKNDFRSVKKMILLK